MGVAAGAGIAGELRVLEDLTSADAPIIFQGSTRRFEITKSVGVYKAAEGLPPADPQREAEQVARLRSIAEDAGMDPAFSEKVFRLVVDEVIRHHVRRSEELDEMG